MSVARGALVILVAAETANLDGLLELRGVPRALLGLIALGACAAWLGVRRGELRPGASPVLVAAAGYVGAVGLTALLSPDEIPGRAVFAGTAVDLVWFAVLLVLLSAAGAPALAAATCVTVLAVLSLLGLLQEFVVGNDVTFWGLAQVPLATDLGSATARHSGPEVDVNFWGRVLVLGVPLALSLWAAGTRSRRTLWPACAVLVAAGVYLTQSRGALLALAAGVLAWPILAGGRHRRLVLGLPVLLAAALVIPGVGSRLASLTPLQAVVVAQPDPSLEGRRAAQRTAVQIFTDHPLTGVGPGRFETVTSAYQRRLPLPSAEVLAPHNLYLQLAAEGGLVLLAAWVLLVLAAAFVAVRAGLLLGARSGRDAALVPGVLAALLSWSVASVFLHLATLRMFLLVVALGAAVDVLARRPTGIPAQDLAPANPRSA